MSTRDKHLVMCKKVKKTVADFPHLVAEWDWEKDGDLKLKDFFGSNRRIDLKCDQRKR